MTSKITITELKPQKNISLYSVITDGGFEFSLTAKGIFENGVKVGKTFTQSEFNWLKAYAAREKTCRYAVYLLGRRDYSSAELEKKLCEKPDCSTYAAQTVCRLVEQGLINDEVYAQKVIDKYIAKGGKKKIAEELYKRCVPKELWQQKLEARCTDMSAAVLEQLIKKQKGRAIADRKERDRLFAFFVRRGYSYDEIKKAFLQYNNDIEDNNV